MKSEHLASLQPLSQIHGLLLTLYPLHKDLFKNEEQDELSTQVAFQIQLLLILPSQVNCFDTSLQIYYEIQPASVVTHPV